MINDFLEKLKAVCHTLNECGVEYLTIGGSAVALHGHLRVTTDPAGRVTKDDFDFWYNPTYGNYFNLLIALEKLGEDVSVFKDEQAPNPERSFFRLDRPDYTIDFLPVMAGLPKFREVYGAKQTSRIGEIDIPFISYEYLIRNKQTLDRPKDHEDMRQLELKKQDQKPRRRPPRQRLH